MLKVIFGHDVCLKGFELERASDVLLRAMKPHGAWLKAPTGNSPHRVETKRFCSTASGLKSFCPWTFGRNALCPVGCGFKALRLGSILKMCLLKPLLATSGALASKCLKWAFWGYFWPLLGPGLKILKVGCSPAPSPSSPSPNLQPPAHPLQGAVRCPSHYALLLKSTNA